MEIRELEKVIKGKGDTKGAVFTQIYRTENAFLYEVQSGNTKYWEVFKRRVNKRFGCESYPSTKAFGAWAWCYVFYNDALNKFNKIK